MAARGSLGWLGGTLTTIAIVGLTVFGVGTANAWDGPTLVSRDPAGAQVAGDSFVTAVSPSGRLVVFWPSTSPAGGPLLHDRLTGVTVEIPGVAAPLPCGGFSADGRVLAIGAPDTGPGSPEVVVYDLRWGTSEAIPGSRGCPSLTALGRYVVHGSASGPAVTNTRTGASSGLPIAPDATEPTISYSGRFVAYSQGGQVFVVDLWTGEVTLESASPAGDPGDGASRDPSISATGRYVAFTSEAENLAGDDSNWSSDVFVRDRATGEVTRVSSATGGAAGSGESLGSAMSADGRYVSFLSQAGDLVDGDVLPGTWDSFVRDLQTGTTTMVSNGSDGFSGEGGLPPRISANGRTVVFDSEAPDLVSGDDNELRDVFVTDR